MAKKQAKKTKTMNLYITPGAFSSFFKRFRGDKSEYDLSGIADLRQLLSNEKAKILYTIKSKNPESIYELSKILKRDFKSVREDIRILKHFGLIDLKHESKGKRKKLKPVVEIDKLQINLQFQ